MALYDYRGRDGRGQPVNGTMEAASADAVARSLLGNNVTPIAINEAVQQRNLLKELRERLAQRPPGLDELVLFSRQMYTLAKAGVPLVRAFRGLIESARNPLMATTLRAVLEDLEGGRELAQAMARHPRVFSSLFVSMVQVGEHTGRLDEAFLQLAQYLEQEKETRERVKQALRYPVIVLVAIALAIGVINVMVIPAFTGIFARSQVALPLATQVLMATSGFMVTYWPHLLAGIVAALFGARAWVRTERGRFQWDQWKLRIPLVGGIIRRALLARFARTFAMTSRSGVALIQALTVVARAVDNRYVGHHILAMRNGIERGDSLTRTAAATGMFTPLVLQMMSVGEETGGVDDMMDEVAGFYEREVDYDLKTLGDAIEPILLVAVGIMVLILALGVFLPMWELSTTMHG